MGIAAIALDLGPQGLEPLDAPARQHHTGASLRGCERTARPGRWMRPSRGPRGLKDQWKRSWSLPLVLGRAPMHRTTFEGRFTIAREAWQPAGFKSRSCDGFGALPTKARSFDLAVESRLSASTPGAAIHDPRRHPGSSTARAKRWSTTWSSSGAGPAGSLHRHPAQQLQPDASIVVLEGPEPGAHILSGAVMDPRHHRAAP